MFRRRCDKRDNWEKHAEDLGFKFHTMYGEPYWNEGVYYQFSLKQIEKEIEDVTNELHLLSLVAAEEIINSEQLLEKLQIPNMFWDKIKDSFYSDTLNHLYGRYDLIYDGVNPAKMIEYNSDTPTSIYEAAHYQWLWKDTAQDAGIIKSSYDQFNSIEDALIERFKVLFARNSEMFFSSVKDNYEEYATIEYLASCAKEAGISPVNINLSDISINTNDEFCDKEGNLIKNLFKLYPWEDMLRDDFAEHILKSNTRFVEPIWKSVLSNKGFLPVLWQLSPNHPNLLESYFLDDDTSINNFDKCVVKPVFSREGSSIKIYENGKEIDSSEDNDYDHHQLIVQKYVDIPDFDGNHPVIGSWVIGEKACGIGIREDDSKITQDLSRFTPHVIG